MCVCVCVCVFEYSGLTYIPVCLRCFLPSGCLPLPVCTHHMLSHPASLVSLDLPTILPPNLIAPMCHCNSHPLPSSFTPSPTPPFLPRSPSICILPTPAPPSLPPPPSAPGYWSYRTSGALRVQVNLIRAPWRCVGQGAGGALID